MKSRGFWGTWAVIATRFALWWTIIAAAFALFLVLAAIIGGEGSLSEWLAAAAIGIGSSVVAGIGLGLLYGFVNAFGYRTSAISVAFQIRDDFLNRLTAAINELGFRPESQSQDALVYRRDVFREKLLSFRPQQESRA